MTTARSLIKSSMRKAGLIFKGETPSAEELNDGLETLNDILASWSNDKLVLYGRTSESFTLTAGKAVYTIGSGGDFDTVRPLFINSAYIRDGQTDHPVEVSLNDEGYDHIQYKGQGSHPSYLNYTAEFPLGKIRLFPEPGAAYTLFLRSEKEFTALTLDTDISFPPGWERALKYALSIEQSAEYGQQPSAVTIEIARRALGLIRSNVIRTKNMDAQPAVSNQFNIYTGFYR